MSKSKDCVIVKYRNGETKKISKGDMKNAPTIERNIRFFNGVAGVSFFNTYPQESIFLIDSDSISEVVFQDFDFTESPFQNFRLGTSKGTTVVFEHCQIDNFKSYDEDDLPIRKGTLIFNDCSVHSLFVTADRVTMEGKTKFSSRTIVDANNVFLKDKVSFDNVDFFGKVIYIDKTNMEAFSIYIATESLAVSDSFIDSSSLCFKYKTLFTHCSTFASSQYQFNDNIWRFADKIKISSDDVIRDVDFARVRFLKSLKKYQEKVNDHFEEVVGDSIDEVDRTVDLEIQGYQEQIDALEVKKREANQGRSSLKQEKLRVLSNKKALGFLPPK